MLADRSVNSPGLTRDPQRLPHAVGQAEPILLIQSSQSRDFINKQAAVQVVAGLPPHDGWQALTALLDAQRSGLTGLNITFVL